MIYLAYVKIRNFSSFGNKEVTINMPAPGKSMLIMGPIGSGKSSIFSAIFWCLTGKKMQTNATLINAVNQKNMIVETGWKIPNQEELLVVRRGMKPPVFEVSGMRGTIQSEMKAQFETKFPLTDPQVLLNLCLLSVSRSLPFFGLEKQQRLQFLRQFIDTTLVDGLTEKAKEYHLNVNREADRKRGEVAALSDNISSVRQKIDKQTDEIPRFDCLPDKDRLVLSNAIDTLTFKTTLANADIQALNDGKRVADGERDYDSPNDFFDWRDGQVLPDLQKLRINVDKSSGLYRQVSGLKVSLTSSIADAQKEHDRIKFEECRAVFKGLIENQTKKLKEYERDLSLIEPKMKEDQKALADAEALISKIESNRRAFISNITIQRDRMERELKTAREFIEADDKKKIEYQKYESRRAATAQLKQLLEEMNNNLRSKSEELALANRQALVAGEYRKLLEGTWGYMTSKMIPFLNAKIPHYMRKMELDFIMQLDPQDISKPIFRGRPGVGELRLEDLSTGQKRVLSMCLSHALRDLNAAQHSADIGFLLVDELSGNMDHEVADRLMTFEFEYCTEKRSSLVLITHDVAMQNRPEWDHILVISRETFTQVKQIK